MSYQNDLTQNNTDLQGILDAVNALPEAGSGSGGGGVELPTLSSPASESEVFKDKEFIDENGVKKVGIFTIDDELSTQQELLYTLEQLLLEKDLGGSSGSNIATCNLTINYNIGYGCFMGVNYTKLNDGNLEVVTIDPFEEYNYSMGNITVTLENVVCNTIVQIHDDFHNNVSFDNCTQTLISDFICTAVFCPNSGNATCTID